MLGIARSNVEGWLMQNDKAVNVHKPDARVVIPNSERPKIAAMAKAGKTQRQIAAEYDENEIREDFTVSERIAIGEAREKEEEKAARKRMARRPPITHRRVTAFQEEQGGGAIRPEHLADD